MDVRSHELLDRCGRQLVRLTPHAERDEPHARAIGQRFRRGGGPLSARVVAIEHHQHTIEMCGEQIGLIPRERRAHETDDRGTARLMHGECVEEAFHDDDGATSSRERAMQIEEHERLAEAGRKPILRLLPVDGAAGVGNQLAGRVVNRNDDPSPKQTLACVQAESKCADGLRCHTA